jgi:hypothetical protein
LHELSAPSSRIKSSNHTAIPLLPTAWEVAGVALHLVGDLPGTGSKISHLGASGTPHAQVLLPLRARSPTSLAPTPSGQKPFGVSCNSSELSQNIVGARLPAIAVGQATSM